MWVCTASLAAACLSGSWLSTDRWRWAQRAVSVCLREGQAWWYWRPSWSPQKDPCVIPRFVEVLQDVMQSHIDSVIHRPVCSVGKLKRIQQGSSDVLQVGQDQSLKWLRDHRRECDRSVVIKSSDFGLFGDGNGGGAFEAAGNFTQLQRSVEDLCKDGGQLVSTDFCLSKVEWTFYWRWWKNVCS